LSFAASFETKTPGIKLGGKCKYRITVSDFCQMTGIIYVAGNDKYARLVDYRRARRVDSMKTPQQLSREAIEGFKAIYQEEFGETLSDDEVQEIAMRLLRFFGILTKKQ
jgi:hypothetical protein